MSQMLLPRSLSILSTDGPVEAVVMPVEGSKVVCSLRLEFASQEQVEKVHCSVEMDNQGYLTSRTEGNAVVAEIRADSLMSLLHTLDDFLACTSVAERIVAKKD